MKVLLLLIPGAQLFHRLADVPVDHLNLGLRLFKVVAYVVQLVNVVLNGVEVNTLIECLLLEWVGVECVHFVTILNHFITDVIFERFVKLVSDFFEFSYLSIGLLAYVLVHHVHFVLKLTNSVTEVVVMVNSVFYIMDRLCQIMD